MASFKAEMFVDRQWASNSIRFATKAEADAYASDLYSRWTQPTDKRSVESPDPVSAKWEGGRLVLLSIPTAA